MIYCDRSGIVMKLRDAKYTKCNTILDGDAQEFFLQNIGRVANDMDAIGFITIQLRKNLKRVSKQEIESIYG